MRTKSIAALTALGGLLCGGTASALPYTATPDIVLFTAGSSAVDGNLETAIAKLCVAGSLDIFYDNTGNLGGNHRAYFCTTNKTLIPGLPTGSFNLLVRKRSSGGSAMGVYPLNQELPVHFMALNSTCVSAGSKTVNGASYPLWKCNDVNNADASTFVSHVPTLGVSDVNPGLFKGSNFSATNPDGGTPFVAATTAKMSVLSGPAATFGLAATLPLYKALQDAQIHAGTLVGCAVGDESEACQPSLSHELAASLMAGRIQTWNKIKVVDGSGAALGDLSSYNGGIKDPNKFVRICRRTVGSGSQAVINAKLLDSPCLAGTSNPAAPMGTANDLAAAGGPVAILGSGAGNVANCLNDYANNTNANGKNDAEDGVPGSVEGWALGVLGTDRGLCVTDPATGVCNYPGSVGYRFVKIDNYSPKRENLFTGKYSVIGELTYQYLIKATDTANLPTANQLIVAKKLVAVANDPSTLPAYTFKWGKAGYVATPASGATVPSPYAFDQAKPVTTFSTAINNVVDNCRVPEVDAYKTYKDSAL